MIKCSLGFIALLISLVSTGQPLRDINYNYLYSPQPAFRFDLKPVRHPQAWEIFFRLEVRDTSARLENFRIEWEGRESIGARERIDLTSGNITIISSTENSRYGKVTMPLDSAPKIIVARIVRVDIKQAWLYYSPLEPTHPVTEYLLVDDKVVFDDFVAAETRVSISGSATQVVSYYNDSFPPATPAFSESMAPVSRMIAPDSTFRLQPGEAATLSIPGLYLVQSDTGSVDGFAFRVERDYPKLARVENLAGPLVYICTRQEYDRLLLARNDKKTFDRIVLNITNDVERARILMRNYFRRVESANALFTSYKQGWKTDRGMIYIIFGPPDEVFRSYNSEIWSYDQPTKLTFNFTKSASIFDPDNYVLIRDDKFTEQWYEVVDLWRSARY